MAVSAFRHDTEDLNSPGLVRVFEYNSDADVWDRMGDGIEGEGNGDMSGEGVAMNADGTIVAIGSPQNDNSFNRAGHVRVFEFDSSSESWELLRNDIRGEASSDLSGSSVSLSSEGTTVAIGAVFNAAAAKLAGHVRVFRYDSGIQQWSQAG
jgi:hypothetical protein